MLMLQVDKQSAHFFGVTINEQQAESGIVVRVTSTAQSKFKVELLFTTFEWGILSLLVLTRLSFFFFLFNLWFTFF